MKTLTVKPVEGRLIIDPATRTPITKETVVQSNSYWRGAIADGDIEQVGSGKVEIADRVVQVFDPNAKQADEPKAAEPPKSPPVDPKSVAPATAGLTPVPVPAKS